MDCSPPRTVGLEDDSWMDDVREEEPSTATDRFNIYDQKANSLNMTSPISVLLPELRIDGTWTPSCSFFWARLASPGPGCAPNEFLGADCVECARWGSRGGAG